MAMCVDHKKSQRQAKEARYLQNVDTREGKWGILQIFGLFMDGNHRRNVGPVDIIYSVYFLSPANVFRKESTRLID